MQTVLKLDRLCVNMLSSKKSNKPLYWVASLLNARDTPSLKYQKVFGNANIKVCRDTFFAFSIFSDANVKNFVISPFIRQISVLYLSLDYRHSIICHFCQPAMRVFWLPFACLISLDHVKIKNFHATFIYHSIIRYFRQLTPKNWVVVYFLSTYREKKIKTSRLNRHVNYVLGVSRYRERSNLRKGAIS